MEKKAISEIMEKYTAGELTVEEVNEKLQQQEAGFHLVPLTEEAARAKREREDAEGFLLPNGDDAKPLPKTPDMRRRRDLAGQVVIQQVRSGYFAVFYIPCRPSLFPKHKSGRPSLWRSATRSIRRCCLF